MDVQLKQLAGFVASANTVEELTRPILRLIQQLTGLESTYLTSINVDAGVQRVEYVLNAGQLQLTEGLEVPWHDTLCKRALQSGRFLTSDVANIWPDSVAAKALGLQTYLSVPVLDTRGEVCGTLCGASSQQVQLANPDDVLQVLQLCAELISVQWTRDKLQHAALARASAAERELGKLRLLAAVSEICVAAQSLSLAVVQVGQVMQQSGEWQQLLPFETPQQQLMLLDPAQQALQQALAQWLATLSAEDRCRNVVHLNPAFRPPELLEAPAYLINIFVGQQPVAGLLALQLADSGCSEQLLILSGISNSLSLLAARLDEHCMLLDANQQLTYHARHDALTGLPNRRYLLEELERLIARGVRQQLGFYLIFVDLDKFKLINDQFGHEIGDEFLRQIAQRLQQVLRKGDFVARQGGDEFVLLCQAPEISTEQSELIINRIRQCCSGVFSLGDFKLLYHGPSLGAVSWHSGDSQDIDLLLSLADVAMYQDKQRRRAMPAPQLLS